MIESRGVQEHFKDLEDAITFMQRELHDSAKAGWECQDGVGIQYYDHEWIVALGFRREKTGAEIDLEEIEGMLQ